MCHGDEISFYLQVAQQGFVASTVRKSRSRLTHLTVLWPLQPPELAQLERDQRGWVCWVGPRQGCPESASCALRGGHPGAVQRP